MMVLIKKAISGKSGFGMRDKSAVGVQTAKLQLMAP